MIAMHKSVVILPCFLLTANVLFLVLAEKEVVAEQPRSPVQSPAATRVKGIQGYRRYHANDSLVGLTVPCTHDEKICFRYNTIFNVERDYCQSLWNKRNCNLQVNRSEYEHGSGHVVGACEEYEDPCPGYRMAYDGRCHRKEVVRDVICGCDTEPTPHFLGGKECRCTPTSPIHVEQPEEEGRCRIPDFRFPDENRNSAIYGDWFEYYKLNCSSENFKCFSETKVWLTEGNGCFKLLERGPCSEDHIVVLDAIAAREEGRVEARCTHERGGCPQGHVRMAFDGQCYPERDFRIVENGWIDTNAFGETSLTLSGSKSHNIWPGDSNICLVNATLAYPILISSKAIPLPPCGMNDKSQCTLYEVESDTPKPE